MSTHEQVTSGGEVSLAGSTVLVTGSDKAETLAAVLEGPAQPDVLPSQIVQPAAGAAFWLVDTAAGARLGVHPGR